MPDSRLPRRICVAAVATAALAAIVAVGCGQASIVATASPRATASPPVASGAATAVVEPSLTPVPTTSGAAPSPSVGQTDTEWGRIWDAIPPSFPVYPGATTTEVGSQASSQLVVPADVTTTVSWMTAALEAAGFETDASGPLEDGSVTLDSTRVGMTTCRAQTTIGSRGGTTIVTILYGAECPFS